MKKFATLIGFALTATLFACPAPNAEVKKTKAPAAASEAAAPKAAAPAEAAPAATASVQKVSLNVYGMT